MVGVCADCPIIVSIPRLAYSIQKLADCDTETEGGVGVGGISSVDGCCSEPYVISCFGSEPGLKFQFPQHRFLASESWPNFRCPLRFTVSSNTLGIQLRPSSSCDSGRPKLWGGVPTLKRVQHELCDRQLAQLAELLTFRVHDVYYQRQGFTKFTRTLNTKP